MSVQFAEAGGSSRPTAAELATFANRAKEIDVGGDDIIELGDDLGLSLLSNPNKVAASPKTSSSAPRQVSFGTPTGAAASTSEMPSIQIKPVDDLGIVDLDAAPGTADIQISRQPDPAPFVINTGLSGSGFGGGAEESNRSNVEEENRQKQDLLTKLGRLDSKGIGGSRLTMQNSLADIKAEYDKRTDSRNLEASIRFQRNALMTFVSGVEMVNDKVGHRLPVKPRLKGWSESVHTNIEDFDEIFEELYDLYKDKAKMHPLMRLVGTLGVSATMYHLTNTMAERSGIPGMADLLHENPDLQRQFAAAAAAKMGGLGNFMSAASGLPGMGSGPGMGMGSGPGMGMGMGMGPGPGMGMGMPPPTPPMRQMAAETRVPFQAASAAMDGGAPAANRARREMRGPTGVDDILKAFETERIMQESGASHASVFTPSGPPPSPPRGVSVLREGIGGRMDPMSEFLAGAGDDSGSVGSGSTMNTERRRGRRKAMPTPVGSVLNLNV